MSGQELTKSELSSLGLAARNQASVSARQSVQLSNPCPHGKWAKLGQRCGLCDMAAKKKG